MCAPRHSVASALRVTGDAGRVLMVQTWNRMGDGLILPGGMVDSGESPMQAASREAAEELGLDIQASRLLVIEHRQESDQRPPSIHFVFAADRIVAENHDLVLQAEEIAEAHWVNPADLEQSHVPIGRPRMQAVLRAFTAGAPVYLET